VGKAKVFQDLGMFTASYHCLSHNNLAPCISEVFFLFVNVHVVDRMRKEGRETLYHVLYTDGDEEELSKYEYVLACQLYEDRHTLDEMEANSEMELHATVEGEESGSEYSDTNDRQARRAERKAMISKRVKKRKLRKESSPKTATKKSKLARLKEKRP
jgi:hypothetical protein